MKKRKLKTKNYIILACFKEEKGKVWHPGREFNIEATSMEEAKKKFKKMYPNLIIEHLIIDK